MQLSNTSALMGPCSTSSLSTLDWARILILWNKYRDRIYPNLTVAGFIEYICAMSVAEQFWIGRNRLGAIEAWCVFKPCGDTILVEAWIGPREFVKDICRTDRKQFKYIEYQRGGRSR